jgi:signal-transduction protein with cAMP-binding, CBS, and nucleotidyltransferase domain
MMQPTRPGEKKESQVETTPVKEIVEPATAIPNELSVQAALDEMRSEGNECSAVTDPKGKLLGSVSKIDMNRKVGGMGHDPQTEPLEQQIDKNAAHCSEDQAIREAEKVMLEAKVDELSVVNRDKVLVGKATLTAVAQKRHADKAEDFGAAG